MGNPQRHLTVTAIAVCLFSLVSVGRVPSSSSATDVLAQAGRGFTYEHKPMPKPEGKAVIRVGYFPNLTHAQALIGMSTGAFQKAVGENVIIDPFLFNAGPSAVEALFAGALDFTYIGPNPAINAYVRSKGEAVRIVSGACSGGAALVVRADAGVQSATDFRGKRIATPQLGNTQDVAARSWLRKQGLTLKEAGGDVQIIPMMNPDQLSLFLKKEIDAAWAVEPWAARLMKEGGGRLFLDERTLWPEGQFVTVHVLASTKFLKQHADILKMWLGAHVELTHWINSHQGDAKKIVNAEIQKLVGRGLRADVLDEAVSRMEFTYDPVRSSLVASAQAAYELGFLGKERTNLSGIYDLSHLNEVLRGRGLKGVQ